MSSAIHLYKCTGVYMHPPPPPPPPSNYHRACIEVWGVLKEELDVPILPNKWSLQTPSWEGGKEGGREGGENKTLLLSGCTHT